MKLQSVLRVALGLVFIAAGLAKGLYGAAPLVTQSIDLMGLSELQWVRVERAWLAISVFEVALGVALACSARAMRWNVALCSALVAFLAWDVARWSAGLSPDCGCFGAFRMATEWWHVATKHVVLWTVAATLLIGGRRTTGPADASATDDLDLRANPSLR